MKTDLTKILSISGRRGLYRYVAQARNGIVIEALSTKERSMADTKSHVSAMADISIYTTEGELKLKEVFLKLKEVLGEEKAPSPKSPVEELKGLFAKAVPDYDPDRFYVSHMKKVVDWYNEIHDYASFDFLEEGEEEPEEAGEDTE